MACAHVGLQQQQVVVGLHFAQAGDPLGRFPIGHARIVEAGGHQHRRVVLGHHLIIGRIGKDIGKGLLALDRVAPFLPFAGCQRQLFVEHRAQHIDERHVRDDRAILLGVLIDDRPHQLAARRASAGGDHALRGVALGDQAPARIDEIVEGVGALEQLALQIPAPPEIIAAADMRDGIGEAAIDEAQPRGRKTRRDRIAIGAVGIEMQRPRPLNPGLSEDGGAVLAHHDAYRHHRPVARGDAHPLGDIEAGIITARDFLRLERLQPAGLHIVIQHRARRDHGLIRQPQLCHVIFGVIRKARGVARLWEGNRGDLRRIGILAQLDLVEAGQAPFGDEEILEQVETGQIEIVRTRDHRLPVAGGFQLRLGEAEVDMIVVGPHPQFAVADIDRIFDALLARLDEDRRGGGIGGGDEAHFAGLVVAGADDQPVFLRGQPGADAEALVFLLVERDVAFNRRADHVELGFERAPFLGRGAVDQRGIARDPHQIAAQIGKLVGQMLAGLEILDPRGVAFRAVGIGRIGEIAPVLADRGCAEAEIFEALGQLVLVDQQFIRPSRSGFAPMLAILRAFLELAPVDVVAILLRDGAVVFLDARAHLGEQRFGERRLGGHMRFEICVLGLHMGQHLFIIHHRIGFVVEPVIGVFDGDPVIGVAVRTLGSDGGLDGGGRRGGSSRSGHAGRILTIGRMGNDGGNDEGDGRDKGGGGKRKSLAADPAGHQWQIPVVGLGGKAQLLSLCPRL